MGLLGTSIDPLDPRSLGRHCRLPLESKRLEIPPSSADAADQRVKVQTQFN